MITLVHPWLLVLLPLPFLLRVLLPPHRQPTRGIYAPKLERIASLAGARVDAGAVVRRRGRLQTAFVGLAWILLVVAIARPRQVLEPITKTTPTRDVLLAVDLSGSMSAEDMTSSAGDRIDRLTAVKSVLDDFLSRREGDRVGLVLFGTAAFVQAPFTEDLAVCRALLDEAEIGMTGPRTVIGDAIGLSISVFERSELEDRVLFLLTDGNDTGSRVPPVEAAAIARDRGITIHVVAVGDPKGAGEQPLDEETLREVATVTGGDYQHAADRAELEAVYDRLDAISTHEISSVSFSPTRDLYQWLVGVVVCLLLAYLLVRDLAWSRANGLQANGLRAGAVALGAMVGAYVLLDVGTDLRFMRPGWLAIVPLAAALVSRLQAQNDPIRSMRRFIDDHLLGALEIDGGEARRLRPAALSLAFLVVGGVALSGPAWDREPPPFQEESAAFVVALEVTPTMMAMDVQPTRLARSVMKIQDLLEARSASRAALVAYAGSAHLVAPLTRDHEVFVPFLVDLVPEIMPLEGDAASAAVEVASQHFDATGHPGAILLVTDGVAPGEIEAIRALREAGAPPVHIWAFAGGDDAVVPLESPPAPAIDIAELKRAARAGGGSLTVVRPDESDAERVASELESVMRDVQSDEAGIRWRDRGYELVAFLLLLLGFWSRPGWVLHND